MPFAALKKKPAPAKPAAKPKPMPASPTFAAPVGMQTKLEVGPAGDRFEQEADRTADSVMRMPNPGMSVAAAPLQISRNCAVCEREEKDEKRVQKKSAGPAEASIGEAPASVHAALRSPGQPLDPASRAYFEPRFGQEFGNVRVHTGMSAARSAREVSAHAYTVGQNIVFAAGRFAPGTHEGRRLIAHELTHVVQQSGSAATLQRAPTPTADPSAERPPAPISLDEQLGARLDAEDALGLKWSKRNDKNYAWSLGLKDRARIRKNWKLSPKLQQEITVKFRFFEGEAKVAYLRTIGPALEEFPEEAIDILAAPPAPKSPALSARPFSFIEVSRDRGDASRKTTLSSGRTTSTTTSYKRTLWRFRTPLGKMSITIEFHKYN